MSPLKEFGKVAGLLGILTLSIGGFMALKSGLEKAKGCQLIEPVALNPLAELVAIGENARRLTNKQKCSWGFRPI